MQKRLVTENSDRKYIRGAGAVFSLQAELIYSHSKGKAKETILYKKGRRQEKF